MENKSDSMKMYKDERNIRSSEDDIIFRNIVERSVFRPPSGSIIYQMKRKRCFGWV